MKKFCIIAALLLLAGLTACHAEEDSALTGIIFDRGHGSAWGNQFYIEVRDCEIVQLRCIEEDTMELESLEHVSIRPEQWEALKTAVLNLELREETSAWKDRLFGHSKLDGGEYRNLSLIYRSGGKEVAVRYRWPDSADAQALEAALEQLAQSAREAQADEVYNTGEFSVLIPNGWAAVAVKDPFSDPPNAEKTNSLNIIKGGTTEEDLRTGLYVRLDYYGPGTEIPEPGAEVCQNVAEIEPLHLGAYTWQGFTGEELFGRVALGKVAVLWTDTEAGNFMASCWLERKREEITLEDPQLQAILASVTPVSE